MYVVDALNHFVLTSVFCKDYMCTYLCAAVHGTRYVQSVNLQLNSELLFSTYITGADPALATGRGPYI